MRGTIFHPVAIVTFAWIALPLAAHRGPQALLRIASALVSYLVAVGAYLALSGSLDVVEIICAAASGLPAALLGERMASVSRRNFPLRLPARAVLRPLLSLLPDAVATGRMLAAVGFKVPGHPDPAQHGGFTRQPFHPGGGEATTRRAAVLIGTSLAPRTFVVRGEDSEELLLHSLPEKPASPDQDWPSASRGNQR